MRAGQICHNDDDYTGMLYCAIFDTPEDGDDHHVRRLLDALNTLTERERRVLEYRFRYSKTLEYIAGEIGCSRERVRQIGVKALRKLRHPERMRDVSVSQIERERNSLRQTVLEQDAVIKELRRHISCLTSGPPVGEQAAAADMLDQDVSAMGLSIRPYNCLWRAGLKTVRDVYELQSVRDFRSLRNFGKTSRDEVIAKMREMGFTDWAERMSNYSNSRTDTP